MSMKKVVRMTESDLHNIIKESVEQILKEEHWEGDINPRVRQAYYNDLVSERMEECNAKIDQYVEEIREYAKAGHLNQVEVACEQIKICTKLLHHYQLEKIK